VVNEVNEVNEDEEDEPIGFRQTDPGQRQVVFAWSRSSFVVRRSSFVVRRSGNRDVNRVCQPVTRHSGEIRLRSRTDRSGNARQKFKYTFLHGGTEHTRQRALDVGRRTSDVGRWTWSDDGPPRTKPRVKSVIVSTFMLNSSRAIPPIPLR